jgi:hypothetical protein
MKEKGAKNARRFHVDGVDLGDGERVLCTVTVTASRIAVRRLRAHRSWSLSLEEAAGLIARRAQHRELDRALPPFGSAKDGGPDTIKVQR